MSFGELLFWATRTSAVKPRLHVIIIALVLTGSFLRVLCVMKERCKLNFKCYSLISYEKKFKCEC